MLAYIDRQALWPHPQSLPPSMSPDGFLQKSLQYSCPSAVVQPHISCAQFMCPPSDPFLQRFPAGSSPKRAAGTSASLRKLLRKGGVEPIGLLRRPRDDEEVRALGA